MFPVEDKRQHMFWISGTPNTNSPLRNRSQNQYYSRFPIRDQKIHAFRTMRNFWFELIKHILPPDTSSLLKTVSPEYIECIGHTDCWEHNDSRQHIVSPKRIVSFGHIVSLEHTVSLECITVPFERTVSSGQTVLPEQIVLLEPTVLILLSFSSCLFRKKCPPIK